MYGNSSYKVIVAWATGTSRTFISVTNGGNTSGWREYAMKDDLSYISQHYYNSIVSSSANATDDPDTTVLPRIRTRHEHCPTPSRDYVIDTIFVSGTSNMAEKHQKAIDQYSNIFTRTRRYGEQWQEWKPIAAIDFTPKNIEIPFTEGVVSDTGYDKVVLSVSGNVAKIHFRAKRTTGNYIIATIPEGYRPMYQANCAITVPVGSGPNTAVYSAVAESQGALRFSGAVPADQIFEGDLVYIIK